MTKLQNNPKSKVLIPGYINIYSELNEKEKRQHHFKTLYKKNNSRWDETLVFLSNEFRKRAKPDAVVLDIGCGNGNFVIDENRKVISHAVGVDVSEEFVKKNVCLDEIKIGPADKLPFDDNTFDVVISLWVLEHLKNPQDAFEEVQRVLKPGGTFMFATPNIYFFPLFGIHYFRFLNLKHFLNSKLYGRYEEDVFESYYRANTTAQIKKALSDGFKIEILQLNYDPSYTAFNNVSFAISGFIHKLCFWLPFTYPHIVGILTKT